MAKISPKGLLLPKSTARSFESSAIIIETSAESILVLSSYCRIRDLYLMRLLRSVSYSAAFCVFYADDLWNGQQPRPDQSVFILPSIQTVPEPDTPRDIKVCSSARHDVPTNMSAIPS